MFIPLRETLITANVSLLASLTSQSRLLMASARWTSAWTGHLRMPERWCSGLKDRPTLGSAPIDAAEDGVCRCLVPAGSKLPNQ